MLRRLGLLTLIVTGFGGALLNTATPVEAVEPFCGDVQLIWARGTGQALGDPDNFGSVRDELNNRLGASLSYSTYELGQETAGFGGFDYPAAGEGFGLVFEWTNTVAGEYADSVAQGRAELDAWLSHRVVACPGELYVLAGLSQGAEVIGESLFDLDQAVLDRVAYVALFGDPTYTTLNSQLVPFADICVVDWLPSWVEGTAPCYSEGIFGPRLPYIPEALEGRVGSWCSAGDFACTSSWPDFANLANGDGGPHGRYFVDGHGAMAMQRAADALEDFLPDQADDIDASFLEFATGTAGADLVIIFDTTGSMSGSISNAKAEATALANLWLSASSEGRIALVEFRDQGDSFVARVVQPLTPDPQAFQSAIDQLVASGGGDAPEAQLSGVMTALDGLDWRAGATKVGVVITDALGKDPEPITGYTRPQVAQHALEIDPVAIYGVNVGAAQGVTDWMSPLAQATAGQVVVLGQGQTLSDLLGELLNDVALSPVGILGGPYFAASGDPVFFSAARSFDPDAVLVSYEWDFDGNGTTDQTTTEPIVQHTYPGAFTGMAVVRVVSADGGEALASANVTVDSSGLADDMPVVPASASATVSAPSEVTVTWTPALSDRADGYVVTLSDSALLRSLEVGAGNSVTITGLDLSEPRTFSVRAANEYGQSPAAVTNAVGGEAPIVTERVSESSTHGQGNGVSDDAYMSAHGRYVTYKSEATNLVTGDSNGVDDVFVHDRLSGPTSRASTDAAGVQGNAASDDPAISSNGRYLVFRSQASNFVAGDTNGTAWDIFVKDLLTGAITRESVSSAGAQANNASADPVISADGRYVVFRSAATNLVTGDTNGQQDLFLRDRTAGTTMLISRSTGGTLGNGLSDDPTISDDGRYVAYHSEATNLVSGDTNAARDVFLYDRTTGATTRISTTAGGAQGNGVSQQSAISADGTKVAFESSATNLVAGDTNAKQDIFVKTLASGAIVRASLSSAGVQGNKGSSQAWLSGNGAVVAFDSTATNLVAGDTNNRSDIFLRVTEPGTTTRVSVATDGTQGNDTSSNPMVSADGATTAFASIASNLVTGDTNNTSDVFVHGPALN